MKIDRMLGITVYLLNHGCTSAALLARRFEVSRRTIQRDIEALGRAGIPVGASYGAKGGYEILHTFQMERRPAYESDDAYIRTALEGLMSAGGDPGVAGLLERLGPSGSGSGPDRRVFLDLKTALEGQGMPQKLRQLEKAAKERETVLFDYWDAAGNRTRRQVEPIALCYRWYDWYLLAYCRLREDYRLFRLSRIGRVEKGLPFSRQHEGAKRLLEQMDKRERPLLSIRLFCRAGTRLPELLQNGRIQEMENGDFTVSLCLPEEETLWRGALLSLGANVQVLSPAKLREELCAAAEAFLLGNGDRPLSPFV